jgi:hypothetical protein
VDGRPDYAPVLSKFNLAFAIRAFAKYIFTIFVLGHLGSAGFRASRDRRPRATPLVSTQSKRLR